jgi:ATP-dependent DNA helicase PIF1
MATKFKWDAQAERALELMEHGRDHVFITGQAGTGKTTLIEKFRKSTKKNMVVLAPTGVAAANIGGRTIHSFCAIGPSSNMNKAKPLHDRDGFSNNR